MSPKAALHTQKMMDEGESILPPGTGSEGVTLLSYFTQLRIGQLLETK